MNDCLVTKLKASVNDDSLLKLGEIKLTIAPTSSSKTLQIASTEPIVVEVVKVISGSGTFSWNNGTNVSKDIIPPTLDSYYQLTFSEGEYIVSISNKYAITWLASGDNLNILLLNGDLSYSEGLTTYNIITKVFSNRDISQFGNKPIKSFSPKSDNNLSGSINVFSNLTSINSINLQASEDNDKIYGNISAFSLSKNIQRCLFGRCLNIEGNIDVFNRSIALTQLDAFRTKVIGDIDTLAQAQIAAGRTSGSLWINASNLTNSGVPFTGVKTITFNSGSYTIS